MADDTMLSFVADIVSAEVSHNSVSANDLPALIQAVYGSLSKLGEEPVSVAEKRKPAVTIRSSAKPDAVTCLECGVKFKMLKRHLATSHNLTPYAYRTYWGLPASYSLISPDYSAKRKALAVEIGLGRKPVAKTVAAPEPVKAKAPRRKKLTPSIEG